MQLYKKNIAQISNGLTNGDFTSREVTESYIERIEKENERLNVYINTCFGAARQMADESDARRAEGKALGPLDGVPMSLKDVVCTVESPTTAASKMLEDFLSPYDATLWKKLKNAGVVLLGKVNTDEFTMGSSTETSYFGITKNPHDDTRVSGGSSGGSAAAVAANMCAGTIGTDTGGSIRQPAHFCGITGLKPTYGRVSRFGTIPMASSLDSPGPMAQTAEGCAMILQTIAGNDPNDSTTLPNQVPDYLSAIQQDIRGLKIGIPKEYVALEGLSEDVKNVLESAKVILQDMGAELVPVSLPHTKYAPAVYYVIAPSEISANMSRYDGVRFGYKSSEAKTLQETYEMSRSEGLGDEVKRRIMIGTYALSAGYYDAYYKKAQKVRTLIKNDFDAVFEKVDVILSPTSPTPAFKIGEKGDDPVQMYLEDVFTIPSALAGLPGISLPVGKCQQNMPIGMQFIAPQLGEPVLLQVAHQMQLQMINQP